ncbi:hypothetical protein B0H14DRAFT_2886032 [Mycena olivaceomarginata]|nr:hypothetical protein B0H14DRAFT_2886032 [Mycena olivaceomarginata]
MPTHHTDWDSPPDYTSEIGGRFRKQDSTLPKVPIPKGPSAAEPHYIYYHIYAPDGILRCKKRLEANPFIGRVKTISVPPPHTVASLKRALVQAEGLPDPVGDLTGLFPSRDARAAMDLNARVDILAGNFGATAETPVALVFLNSPVQSLIVASEDDVGDYLGSESTLLYYRLYNRGGEEKSVRPFDPSEPGLGRVRRELISPPRNALYGKPIYLFADLFTDLGADSAIPSADLVDDAAGSSKEHPIVLVQPERRAGLYNRPVQILALLPLPYRTHGPWVDGWLAPSVGDILQTDGITTYEKRRWAAYTAVDEHGRTGCAKLLDEPPSWCGIQ